MKRFILLFLLACSAPAFAGDCAIEIIGADMPMCDGAVQVARKAKGYSGAYPDPSIVPQTELLAWFEEKMPYAPSELGLNTYTRGDEHGEGNNAFSGAVLVSKTLVVLTPFESDYVGLYNPVTDTYTRGPAHGEGNDAFAGGVLLPSGKVLMTPGTSDYLGLYDPVTNTYTRGPLGNAPDYTLFRGSMLPSGKVYISGYNGDYGLYNPITDTITTAATGAGGDNCVGTQLHPNGNCYSIGFFTTRVWRYTSATGIRDNSIQLIASSQLRGCGQALSNDGKIVSSPYGPTSSYPMYGWYDPVAATRSAPLTIAETDTSAFSGITKLQNGLFCLVPYEADYIGIYDSNANTYTRGPAHGEGASAFSGGVLIEGGKVILAPRGSGYVGIYNSYDSGMTTEELVNPWMNHGGF